tara:strand:- start:2121 stop:2666 length:546 start_codon:yes stop_codon:yes gene_type:complete
MNILSCSEVDQKEIEFYSVINVVFKDLSFEPPPSYAVPPGNKNFKLSDTIKVRSNINSKQIIAIKKSMESNILKKYDFENLDPNKMSLSKVAALNIHKINHRNKDSLIYFKKELLEPKISDYLKFDKLISFSQVLFNSEYNEAYVIGNVGTSGLAGSSSLFFLKKINGRWKIINSKVLEIS